MILTSSMTLQDRQLTTSAVVEDVAEVDQEDSEEGDRRHSLGQGQSLDRVPFLDRAHSPVLDQGEGAQAPSGEDRSEEDPLGSEGEEEVDPEVHPSTQVHPVLVPEEGVQALALKITASTPLKEVQSLPLMDAMGLRSSMKA